MRHVRPRREPSDIVRKAAALAKSVKLVGRVSVEQPPETLTIGQRLFVKYANRKRRIAATRARLQRVSTRFKCLIFLRLCERFLLFPTRWRLLGRPHRLGQVKIKGLQKKVTYVRGAGDYVDILEEIPLVSLLITLGGL